MRRRVAVVTSATVVAGAVLVGSWRGFGWRSRRFAFVAVWAPMTWLGTISKVLTPRLPSRCHRLARFEHGGARIYELLGVRVVKRLLRRGPISAFNPGLHLPDDPTTERLARLDQRMRDAEASHALMFVASGVGAAAAWAAGSGSTARRMVGWNVALNGYPWLLQRYNRGLLERRFADAAERAGAADRVRSLTRDVGGRPRGRPTRGGSDRGRRGTTWR